MAAAFKTAGAMGSALPDPVADGAALAPIPGPAIANKPAPGQTGPRGMAPRTTYSRVNTGAPPIPDAGASAQKNGANRGMESLPAKVAAHRGFMTMHTRPLLHDMVKAAIAGTSQRLSVNLEASRQAATQSGTKTASVRPPAPEGHISTELATKLADALGFIERQIIKEADGDLGPGHGPNTLQVMEATSSESNIDAGESGQASSQNQPPRNPATQAEKVQQGNAGTGLETNDDTTHPEQPLHPIKNASASLEVQNLARLQKVAAGGPEGHHLRRFALGNPASAAAEAGKGDRMKAYEHATGHKEVQKSIGGAIGGAAGAVGGGAVARRSSKAVGAVAKKLEESGSHFTGKAKGLATAGGAILGAAAGGSLGRAVGAIKGDHDREASRIHGLYSKNKTGSAPIALLRKLAEDAINPAHISAPANVDPAEPPPGAAEAGVEVPSEPGDVTSQKRLISSNEAAINYTKREAKADPKSDVAQVLQEAPLSSATDKVLERAFDNTGRAGVKISSAGNMAKTAMQVSAQRAVLAKLLEKAASDVALPDKTKKSMGMAPTTPQAATGANAATMGM